MDVNHTTGQSKCTPLHYAATNNDLPLIKLLIRHSADRHATDDNDVSPLEMDGVNMASWVVLNNTPGPKGLVSWAVLACLRACMLACLGNVAAVSKVAADNAALLYPQAYRVVFWLLGRHDGAQTPG